jgi:MOSC domain-containing protein YiiM/GNAT superfamily N-acetyltransferase
MVETDDATRPSTDGQTDAALGNGRVVQVNVSTGGVPKHAVPGTWVGRLGLDGDVQAHPGIHGGPHRAVCMLGIEVIRRVSAEGHPIVPGSVGENLTTEGVELARLEPGTRLAFDGGLELEISAPANPCDTIRGSFSDGKSGRISILRFPGDSRVYGRVLTEGTVTAGERFAVLPPRPDTDAGIHGLLERLEKHEVRFWEATWAAVAAGGADLRLLDLGDAYACAAPAIPGLIFNRAFGLRMVPNLRHQIVDHFRDNGVKGWLVDVEPPTPGVAPDQEVGVFAIEPDRVPAGPSLTGLRIRRVDADKAVAWQRVLLEAFEIAGPEAEAWLAAAPHIARLPGMQCLLAEVDGRPAAAAGLYSRARIGGLIPAAVLPEFRGRGIHAALIADRARRAEVLNCELVTTQAELGGASERNMMRMGLVRLHLRGNYAVGHGPPTTVAGTV